MSSKGWRAWATVSVVSSRMACYSGSRVLTATQAALLLSSGNSCRRFWITLRQASGGCWQDNRNCESAHRATRPRCIPCLCTTLGAQHEWSEIVTEPRFSIVTPTRNSLEKLKRCVGSVRGQTGVCLEHLIQDAYSTDGTREWLQCQRDL